MKMDEVESLYLSISRLLGSAERAEDCNVPSCFEGVSAENSPRHSLYILSDYASLFTHVQPKGIDSILFAVKTADSQSKSSPLLSMNADFSEPPSSLKVPYSEANVHTTH